MNTLRRVCVLSLACGLAAEAAQITNNFDDLANVPLDGLFDKGILFNFKIGALSSTAGIYGASFPADSLIGGTVITGAAGSPTPPLYGTLTATFEQPTTYLSFALGLDSDLSDTFSLALWDENLVPQTTVQITTAINPGCNPATDVCFSEAQYVYAGGGLIGAAQWTFGNTQADTFALSTLTYDSAVPEPASSYLLASGVVMLILARLWRYRAGLSRRSGAN